VTIESIKKEPVEFTDPEILEFVCEKPEQYPDFDDEYDIY